MEITPLHRALAAFLGQKLTPEVASGIVCAVLGEADRSIDPQQFEPQQHGPYTLRVERFRDILGELHPLHLAHWQETERYRHVVGFEPDYDAAVYSEQCGELIQFTARVDGQLVGHLRLYLGRSRHSGTLFAHEDTLFVAVEHRQGMLGLQLLRYAEAVVVRGLGVREMRYDAKLVEREGKMVDGSGALARRLGFKPVATQYVKAFEDADHG